MKKKGKLNLPLYAVLKSGQKAIFYKDNIDELQELDNIEISKRLYKMYQFEGDGRIKLKHHLISGSNTDIKKMHKEIAAINFNEYTPLLRISSKAWNFAIEEIDFEMNLDGTINWKF